MIITSRNIETNPKQDVLELFSGTIYKQLGNARISLRGQGLTHKECDEVMRRTLARWLADQSTDTADGIAAEYLRVLTHLIEAFRCRGFEAPKPKAPPPWRWRVFDFLSGAPRVLGRYVRGPRPSGDLS